MMTTDRYRYQATPDCAVAADESGCVILRVTMGEQQKTVTVTNVAAFIQALEDARAFARALTEGG